MPDLTPTSLPETLAQCEYCRSPGFVAATQKPVPPDLWQVIGYRVVCANHDDCGAQGPFFADRETAVAAWNRRALRSPPEGWKDIETAPKDGMLIIVSGHHWGDDKRERWVTAASFKNDRWMDDHDGVSLYTPTHWQALPAPPGTPPLYPVAVPEVIALRSHVAALGEALGELLRTSEEEARTAIAFERTVDDITTSDAEVLAARDSATAAVNAADAARSQARAALSAMKREG